MGPRPHIEKEVVISQDPNFGKSALTGSSFWSVAHVDVAEMPYCLLGICFYSNASN